MVRYTPYHGQYLAHRITLAGADVDGFAKSLGSARVDLNPHQVDAAIFALAPPIPRGAILADEVGLGKTIEASLVMAQRWAERKRRILLIVPASLRKQWSQELADKFGLPSKILEARSYKEALKAGARFPFEVRDSVVITSYEFAAQKQDDVRRIAWDLVVCDEAHRLRNVYKPNSIRARALKTALADRFKLLLTATPLQNSLMELYGLVSIIDDHVFGSAEGFKLLYADRNDPAGLPRLRDRLRSVCRRTLRKDVQEAGHINYTKRYAVTAKFEPHEAEVELYERLSRFLQRRDTAAFGDKPNQLVTLVVRKILGSSTFAVAETLDRIIQRLKANHRAILDDVSDIEEIDEIAEEIDEDEELNEAALLDPAKLSAEIKELEGYLARARAISVNAKGERLLAVLKDSLAEVVAKGGQRKAVIFTESVRTQRYLADLLSANGYDGEITLLNGSNTDPLSQAIYKDWIERHRGADAISGSKTADMKAAIVEAFRDQKTLLIATESGAEGINLQFCSLLVNFDLPWNPQRVEQRIGRCHRYGQKQDVLVVNFLNLKNRAEERVFELLDLKFRLFQGVFGASDEVLGAIETGTDIERRIFEIYQSARTDAEIDAAFDRLRQELEDSIRGDALNARDKILASFDRDVVKVLKSRMVEIDQAMDTYEERLVALARAELPDAAFAKHGSTPIFSWRNETWTTGWPLADEKGWRFFRLVDGNLAQELADAAKSRLLPTQKLVFHYGQYENGVLADVKEHIGCSGWIKVSKLALAVAGEKTERLLIAVAADDGRVLAEETVDRLFCVPAIADSASEAAPEATLGELEARLLEERVGEARTRNAEFLVKESEKLDLYADDLAQGLDAKIKALDEEIKAKRKEARAASAMSLEERLKLQREVKKLESEKDDLAFARHQQKREIGRQMEQLLDEIEESLKVSPSVEPIFTIRFEIEG